MNYKLSHTEEQKSITKLNYKKFWELLKDEKKSLIICTINILIKFIITPLAFQAQLKPNITCKPMNLPVPR